MSDGDEATDPSADSEERKAPISRREMLERTGLGVAATLVGCGDDGAPAELDGSLPADASGADGGPGADAGADGGPDEPDARPLPDGGMDGVRALPSSLEFGLGVASGDVTASSAILWTRYDGDQEVTVVVWEMLEDGTDGARVVERAVTPADGGFVHETVEVIAGQRYGYAFVEAGVARSAIGRFRAAIADDAMEPLVFGAVSCTTNSRDAFPTLERAGERDDLDGFLLLGDTTYNDGDQTLDQFRSSWAGNLGKEGYLAMRQVTSLVATWDDHEIDNNWNPETIEASVEEAGRQAFFEHLPLERLEGAPNRIWRRRRWGRTLELFVLDCRGERRPSTRDDADAQYISPEQMTWLKDGLADSPAVFKVILNSVGITDWPFLLDLGSNDRWEGYAAQREEILSFIEDSSIPGVFWVSGDFHFASLGPVGDSGELGAGQWEVLAGPGGQTANPLHTSLGSRWTYKSGTNNYTELRFDPTAGSIRVRFIDGDGNADGDETITI